MTTISVPLSADLLQALERLVREGAGSNKADVLRRALKRYIEEQAVEAVLRASKEVRLQGNLDELASRL